MVLILAIAGWGFALALAVALKRHRCPIEYPTKAVLVNSAGLPESLRTLRGPAPKEYTRPRGKGAATIYPRIGTAVLYQATEPRQPQ
jgi:hypothetical protein